MDNQAAPRKTRMTRLALPVLAALLLLAAGSVWWLRPAVHEFDVPQGYAGGVDHRADQPVRAHCQAHFDAGQSESGFYRVRGPWFSALPVYCRMEKGRGLTLVLYGARPYAAEWNTADAIYPEGPPQVSGADNYKLADAVINYLGAEAGDAYRLERLDWGFAWEMQAVPYNHVGEVKRNFFACKFYVSDETKWQGGAELAKYNAQGMVTSYCVHETRGLHADYTSSAPIASRRRNTNGYVWTNDYAYPQRIEEEAELSYAGKANIYIREKICTYKYGTPQGKFTTTESLRKKIAWEDCVRGNRKSKAKMYISNNMNQDARVALYVIHPSAKGEGVP